MEKFKTSNEMVERAKSKTNVNSLAAKHLVVTHQTFLHRQPAFKLSHSCYLCYQVKSLEHNYCIFSKAKSKAFSAMTQTRRFQTFRQHWNHNYPQAEILWVISYTARGFSLLMSTPSLNSIISYIFATHDTWPLMEVTVVLKRKRKLFQTYTHV